MTDQGRPSGYRGALPTRNDAMARPWVIAVIAAFALMFVLAFVGFPSSLLKGGGSPSPGASFSAVPSTSTVASASASPTPESSE